VVCILEVWRSQASDLSSFFLGPVSCGEHDATATHDKAGSGRSRTIVADKRTSQADERDSPSLAVTEFPCLVVTLSTSPPCCTSTLSLASLKAGEFKLTHRNARCLPHPSWPPGRHFAHHHHRSLLTPLPSSFFPPILPTTGKALHPKPNHEHQHQPRREGVGGEHVPVAGPAPSVRLQGTLWPS